MAAHMSPRRTPDSKMGTRTKTEDQVRKQGQARKRVAPAQGQEPRTSARRFASKVLVAFRKKPMTCKAYAPLPGNEVAEPIGL